MKNKTLLITGGTGTLGQELVKKAIKGNWSKIIILSRDEDKQYRMRQKIISYPVRYYIGDIRDRNRLMMAFRGVDYIIHAAALKHVTTGESDPWEVVHTNVIGAKNIIDASIFNNVKRVLAVSSDKAVNPLCLYGATKQCSDKLFLAANVYSGASDTKFSVVRFGNFWGSRGSVVEYYREMKKNKAEAIPITEPGMKRYFILPERAAAFCLNVLGQMRGQEIYIPKMKEMEIAQIANNIHPTAKMVIIGKRKGEKLREDLMTTEEEQKAQFMFNKYWRIPDA